MDGDAAMSLQVVPGQEQEPKPERVTTSDPHRSLKHGLRVAFGDMAERHSLWMEPAAVLKAPTARETLAILGFSDWETAGRALDERAGSPHLGARLTQRRLKLCTDRTLVFKRCEQPWSRSKWLAVLGMLFGDLSVVFFVSSSYMCRYPFLGWRMLTPLPPLATASQEKWDAVPDGHEAVLVFRRKLVGPADEPP